MARTVAARLLLPLLVAAAVARLPERGVPRTGCLRDRRCRPPQICIDDGVTGRCMRTQLQSHVRSLHSPSWHGSQNLESSLSDSGHSWLVTTPELVLPRNIPARLLSHLGSSESFRAKASLFGQVLGDSWNMRRVRRDEGTTATRMAILLALYLHLVSPITILDQVDPIQQVDWKRRRLYRGNDQRMHREEQPGHLPLLSPSIAWQQDRGRGPANIRDGGLPIPDREWDDTDMVMVLALLHLKKAQQLNEPGLQIWLRGMLDKKLAELDKMHDQSLIAERQREKSALDWYRKLLLAAGPPPDRSPGSESWTNWREASGNTEVLHSKHNALFALSHHHEGFTGKPYKSGEQEGLRPHGSTKNLDSKPSSTTVPPQVKLEDLLSKQKEAHKPEEKDEQRHGNKQTQRHVQEKYGYIITNEDPLSVRDGLVLLDTLARSARLPLLAFADVSVIGPAVAFQLNRETHNLSISDVTAIAVRAKTALENSTGLKILQIGVGEQVQARARATSYPTHLTVAAVVLTACAAGVLLATAIILGLRRENPANYKVAFPGDVNDGSATDAPTDYQELCRQRMAGRGMERGTEKLPASRGNSVSSQVSDIAQHSPSSRSSTSSWSEEPVSSHMDISTGHIILSYMEDHLQNAYRLQQEWETLCTYQAEPSSCSFARTDSNKTKNRTTDALPYDHARVKLKTEYNHSKCDYINASPITDHDPRSPCYIATQGPLLHTVPDFWQMVWESGCVVIVMLTPLCENGVRQSQCYWPDEGSTVYHIYEVNLVSEHIWCEDYLVRSFYLKNLRSGETRTVTQFHYLSWSDHGVPSTRSLLDFRRKVNKCYRGRSCPVTIHCSNGAGRTGTYLLIDMVLNRMAKGAKELDIAATLEHIRDQRANCVQTKEQFEFALTAVAEEVNAILKALPK
uniref:receptor-type tyrosine-protein phosphatase N2-like isoform X2 n=1 Tax=Myxine glutinosa TaxID=7769 RepID=UPI00358F68D4